MEIYQIFHHFDKIVKDSNWKYQKRKKREGKNFTELFTTGEQPTEAPHCTNGVSQLCSWPIDESGSCSPYSKAVEEIQDFRGGW